MARSFVYIVSENPEVMEKVKKSCEGVDVSFYTYNGSQWREGMENPFFRSQLVMINHLCDKNVFLQIFLFCSEKYFSLSANLFGNRL